MAEGRPILKPRYSTIIDGQTVTVQRIPAKGKAKFKRPISSEQSPFTAFKDSNGTKHRAY